MADVAASVLARLKSKAAKSGRSYQLCLQLFCQEAFCRKIDTKTDDFSDVLNAIGVFLTEPLFAAIGKYAFTQKWSANSCAWNNMEVQRNM